MITQEQIKMAKEKLGWSSFDLADRSELHRNTIYRALNFSVHKGTLSLIQTTFEKNGIRFSKNGCYFRRADFKKNKS